MRILAIDTSTELGSVAVCADGEILAEVSAKVRARHGETLLPLVAYALEHAAVERDAIDLIAVGIGPGSFTGTRIGVATAKGLAIALDRPIIGVVSLYAIARAAPGAWIAPAVDAHKGEVYVALYERRDGALIERLAPMHAFPADALALVRGAASSAAITGCGSGHRRYPEELGAAFEMLPPIWDAPRASVLALIAEQRFRSEGPDDRATLEPLYLRPSDAKLP